LQSGPWAATVHQVLVRLGRDAVEDYTGAKIRRSCRTNSRSATPTERTSVLGATGWFWKSHLFKT